MNGPTLATLIYNGQIFNALEWKMPDLSQIH